MELKHGYYHLIAILTVSIWGLTFIATKVLIGYGLTPQEIFFYRFLIAYAGIWIISPKRLFGEVTKSPYLCLCSKKAPKIRNKLWKNIQHRTENVSPMA